MSDLGISNVAPQFQSVVATALKQPNATARETAVRAAGTVNTQIATALAAISSGVNIQI